MAKKNRNHIEGGLYHVTCRGNNKESIFEESPTKKRYINIVKSCKIKHPFKLLAWTIMSNHVHLLIQVEDVPLSIIMHNIQSRYAKWYNWVSKRSGHVFEKRYYASLCRDQAYFLNLIRYIHQNPKRAGLAKGLEYPWCSHMEYIGEQDWGINDSEEALSYFTVRNKDIKSAKRSYIQFMEMDEDVIPKIDPDELWYRV